MHSVKCNLSKKSSSFQHSVAFPLYWRELFSILNDMVVLISSLRHCNGKSVCQHLPVDLQIRLFLLPFRKGSVDELLVVRFIDYEIYAFLVGKLMTHVTSRIFGMVFKRIITRWDIKKLDNQRLLWVIYYFEAVKVRGRS